MQGASPPGQGEATGSPTGLKCWPSPCAEGSDRQPFMRRAPAASRCSLEQATADPIGLFPRLWRRGPTVLSFERELRSYDARAFNNATHAIYAKDWRSTTSEDAEGGIASRRQVRHRSRSATTIAREVLRADRALVACPLPMLCARLGVCGFTQLTPAKFSRYSPGVMPVERLNTPRKKAASRYPTAAPTARSHLAPSSSISSATATRVACR